MNNKLFLEHNFSQWKRNFQSEARADNYNELNRHLEYLELDFSPKNLQNGTNLLLAAILAYKELDCQDGERFLHQQRYRLSGLGLPFYCLNFMLGSNGIGRVLTDDKFTEIDFADLYGHAWGKHKSVGYALVWISRIDGNSIGSTELGVIDQHIKEDLFFDYSEDEINVNLAMTHVEDTVCLSVQDHF